MFVHASGRREFVFGRERRVGGGGRRGAIIKINQVGAATKDGRKGREAVALVRK